MEEELKKQYLFLLSEIIAKEAVVFGYDIVALKARSLGGLVLDDNGIVVSIKGDATEVTEKLVNGYIDLAGQIAKDIILPIFTKYPLIKI
jgi:hypothetical protein